MRNRRTRISIVMAQLALCMASFSGAMAAPEGGNPTILGAGFTGRPFVLHDDVVMETGGLYEALRDYADAAAPLWLGWHGHDYSGYWRELVVDGALVVALRDDGQPGTPAGCDIVDVSDAAAAMVVGRIDTASPVSAWLRGGVLVLDLGPVLSVWDLADPSAPVARGFLAVGAHDGRRWLTSLGSTLYAVDHGGFVRAYDMTAPLAPQDLGTIDLAMDRIDALAAVGGLLQVAGAQAPDAAPVLTTWDVSDPAAPQMLAEMPLSSGAGVRVDLLAARGGLLAASLDEGAVQACDLTDPAHPRPGRRLPLAADHLAVSAGHVFANAGDDLWIHARAGNDIAAAEPVRRRVLPRLGAVFGDGVLQWAQVHDQPGLLLPVDAANPANPLPGDAFDTGRPGQFALSGTLGAMVGGELEVRMLDLADPQRPDTTGSLFLPGLLRLEVALGPTRLALEYVRVESGSIELAIVDVSDPAAPVLGGTFATIDASAPRDMDGNLLVGMRARELWFYDLGDAYAPQVLGSIRLTTTVLDAVTAGGYAYAVTDDLALHVVDVSDPAAAAVVATLPPGSLSGELTLQRNRLYSLGFSRGQIVDVTDPTAPELVADFPSFVDDAGGYGLAFAGNVLTVSGLLVTMRDDGLQVPPPPVPGWTPARLLPAYPNPFNAGTTIAFEVARPTALTISLYDLRGRRVARLADGRFAAGPHTVPWLGGDAGGRRVAAGVYLVRLAGPGFASTGRVTLVR